MSYMTLCFGLQICLLEYKTTPTSPHHNIKSWPSPLRQVIEKYPLQKTYICVPYCIFCLDTVSDVCLLLLFKQVSTVCMFLGHGNTFPLSSLLCSFFCERTVLWYSSDVFSCNIFNLFYETPVRVNPHMSHPVTAGSMYKMHAWMVLPKGWNNQGWGERESRLSQRQGAAGRLLFFFFPLYSHFYSQPSCAGGELIPAEHLPAADCRLWSRGIIQ